MEPLQLFERGEMGQPRIIQCLPLQMKVNFKKAMTLINTPPSCSTLDSVFTSSSMAAEAGGRVRSVRDVHKNAKRYAVQRWGGTGKSFQEPEGW